MSKASESRLNDLHYALTEAYIDGVTEIKEETTFDEDGNEVGTGVMKRAASPAMLAGAAKFLKDNDITTDIEQDDNMSNLKDLLANKQRHSRLQSADEAARH